LADEPPAGGAEPAAGAQPAAPAPQPPPPQPQPAAAAAAPPPPPAAPAAAAPGESLCAKVDRIKIQLELAPELTAVAGIREANAAMGLTADGLSLPAQADRLIASILGS